ncbi:hypothetical protein SAMN04487846_2719 [Microbacterium sp. cf046]|uniref:hypothetical protein n=1 Tax=Microbacterium sp. cf046 TaxID=1761803 RepID=UPI0008DF97DC|nr:hypothetical protein [Microbacterium sp. cf046]SFS13554.1 hypothetical protein SAMN04487846_2719 [Microbacterium sp. cf046]
MTRWASWAIGAALVTAAWGVAVITPPEEASELPFPVAVEIGERGTGRNVAITVSDIRRAQEVRAGEWAAEGNWVVVDLDAEAVVSEFGTLLTLATLEIDGRTFGASERPESLLRASLAVGIPRSGSVAFELPADVQGGHGVLTFGLDTDPRLDSIIVLDIDLDDIDIDADAELRPTGWSER